MKPTDQDIARLMEAIRITMKGNPSVDWDLVKRTIPPFYPKPREWWINIYISGNGYVHSTLDDAVMTCGSGQTIHVREVLE